MKLSILDQAPVSSNQTAHDALVEAMKLAQAGEKLGYRRYWIAEHHDLEGLACSAPEVMLGYIGAHTHQIRIGAGAVLLPYYKPYKVAEQYNMLATLFPGRIDVGIGRAPGGSAEATNALSETFLKSVWNMPNAVDELVSFLHDVGISANEHVKLSASPVPNIPAVPWLLGTSKKSAQLAAEKGLAYAFGHFMSDQDGPAIVQKYRESFEPQQQGDGPKVVATVSAICAETTEQAEDLALSSLIWGIQKGNGLSPRGVPSIQEAKLYELNEKEQEELLKRKEKMVIGNPSEIKMKLEEIESMYHADEIMIVTITHLPADKIRSYELIANALIHNE
ncbi:LLM class flavin-dependent oxidoreductase [Falsibacillus albus]|uniref:LLM class flavin-dependent oxidoreductase n=1 Tax=Falsibacillus albus TaxID=2478915 RepID=A0A3L7K1A8_9BACI|nr:LLM class flavin-dependent oxidoreductase [Falsibacillus albus]RLQ96134.1 LLM class flavin-dependent oxidoreductase [Falsibacillus albus]